MSISIISISQNVKKLVEKCIDVKVNEEVLIVTDQKSSFEIVDAIVYQCSLVGAIPNVITMPARTKAGQNATNTVEKALYGADVVISLASTSITHTRAVQQLINEKKIRFVTMPGINLDQMENGAASANYEEVKEITESVAKILENANTIHVTSPNGSDFTASIKGMPCQVAAGFCTKPGDFACFPDGEAYQGPVEGTTSGRIVLDGSVHMLGLLQEPIELNVVDGRIAEIDGGHQAQRLKEIVFNTENGDNIAEISVGTNPMARLTGNVSEDKKGLGRVHVGIGDNIIYGGTTESDIHIDGVILNPTVKVDGNLIIKHGRMLN